MKWSKYNIKFIIEHRMRCCIVWMKKGDVIYPCWSSSRVPKQHLFHTILVFGNFNCWFLVTGFPRTIHFKNTTRKLIKEKQIEISLSLSLSLSLSHSVFSPFPFSSRRSLNNFSNAEEQLSNWKTKRMNTKFAISQKQLRNLSFTL